MSDPRDHVLGRRKDQLLASAGLWTAAEVETQAASMFRDMLARAISRRRG